MSMFLATFVIMVLAVLGMAIGVMTGRRELKGSCGGLNNGGDCICASQDRNNCDLDNPSTESQASGRWAP